MDEAQRERVKLTVRGLYDSQQLRIQLELRIQRLVRDGIMTVDEAKSFFKLPFSWFEKAEKEMEKLVWAEVKSLPIVQGWLIKVKGIGPRLSGLLVANIADIGRFDNPAKLWAYSGLHVIDGRAVKRASGQKANWNRELKTTAWKIGKSFVKAGGPYRDLYDRYKARIIERERNKGNTIWCKSAKAKDWIVYNSQNLCDTQNDPASHSLNDDQRSTASQKRGDIQRISASQEGLDTQPNDASQDLRETQDVDASQRSGDAQHDPASHTNAATQIEIASHGPNVTQKPTASQVPEWTIGRIDNMAMRYAVKRMLAHLWQVWREMEGLPTREPYAVAYLGHTHADDPWKYVESK